MTKENRNYRIGHVIGEVLTSAAASMAAPLLWGVVVGGPGLPLFPNERPWSLVVVALVSLLCHQMYGVKRSDLPDSNKILRLSGLALVAAGAAALGVRPSAFVTGGVLLFAWKTVRPAPANAVAVVMALTVLVAAAWLSDPAMLLTSGDAPTFGNIVRDLIRFAVLLVIMSSAVADRNRVKDLEQERKTAVTDERARIARELHDVVAHHVSVMTIQTEAARSALPKSASRADTALAVAGESGRTALTELRRLLGVLRAPSSDSAAELEPQPDIGDIGSLVTDTPAAEVVRLSITGDQRPVPAGVGLSAYRIVQEALLNAQKHAGASEVRVTVHYGEDAVTIEVTDDGRGGTSDPGPGTGNGLIGMQERAALVNGTVEAGPDRSGAGWVVRAVLPLEPVSA